MPSVLIVTLLIPMLQALQNRNSHPRLTEPAPTAAELEQILLAGLRAPDHGRLRPWEFVAVSGERRHSLGEIFERSLLMTKPEASAAEQEKARHAPLRAPLIVAGLLKPKVHPKVPRVEQVAAVACALHGMLLAAESLGYGGVWRTGTYARDPSVISALGGEPGDEIVGFLYIGTREGESKPLPEEKVASFFRQY
ncbi:MAG: nitroreductase family protein [Halieaceae bacterium]